LLHPEDPVAVGGHRLAGRLRSGGAGLVYVAHGRGSGLVTVKTAHPGAATDPEPVRARLRAEAACARRLPSSCSVRLLVDGTDHTPPYLVSEHLDGPSLERIVDVKGPLAPALVTALAVDLAQALSAVHAAGVMHGDLAPGNVVFTRNGLRILDFGVAEHIPGDPAEIGAVADNPGWLAPELLTGGTPGPACDIFGWGCLVAYAATGQSPYPEAVPGEPARFRPVDTGALRQPLRALVDAAVAEDPAVRPSAADLVVRLAACAEPGDLPVVATSATPATTPPTAPATTRPPAVTHRVRPPLPGRTRALVSALLVLTAILIAVPTGTERPATPPPTPQTPAAPPKKPRPRRISNTATMALYGRPSTTARRTRPAPHRPAPRLPGGTLWMTCSGSRPGWCAMSGAPGTSSPYSRWRFSWGARG
jgi:serine/threonine protein kinase